MFTLKVRSLKFCFVVAHMRHHRLKYESKARVCSSGATGTIIVCRAFLQVDQPTEGQGWTPSEQWLARWSQSRGCGSTPTPVWIDAPLTGAGRRYKKGLKDFKSQLI